MAITLATLQDRVRTRFEQATSVRLDDDRLTEAINEGVEELAEATEYYEQSETVPVMGGRTYYDLRGILAPNALRVTAVWSTAVGRWLQPLLIKDIGEDQWEKTTGDARHWFMRGLFHFGVYPHSTGSAGSYLIYYSAVPATLVADGDTVAGLPQDYSDCLEEYALYELYAQEGQTDTALHHWQNYKEKEDVLRAQTKRRTERARTGVMGGRR